MITLARQYGRYGYRRIAALLRDAGWHVNDKRIERLWRQEGLKVPKKQRNGQTFERLVLESVDWVNVVALTPSGQSVMIRQYRFGVGYTTLETPGGMVDPGENSLQAAKRELMEETGYSAQQWQYLGAVEPNPAFHNHLCHHWLATDVELVGTQQQGAGENIDVELMSVEEIRQATQQGELKHALALSALSRVMPLWPLPFVQED